MSKKKKLKVLKKPEQSLPKDSILSPEKPQSPPENISDIPSIEVAEFSNAINQSRQNIAQADEVKGKRGRKALPRDAAGNIIRDATASGATPAGVAPLILNQQSIEENKVILKSVFPVVNKFAEQYAGNKEARATEEEETALIATGAILLEKYMPTVMGKYGTEATFCFVLLAWGKRVHAVRGETIAKLKADELKKSELQNGGLPTNKNK